jgi:hypothetical protein
MTAPRAVEQSMFPDLRADRAVGPLVPSVISGTNADLIAAVAPLYLDGPVLDVTYGEGSWWKLHRPAVFQGHDLKTDGVDFRRLPHPDRSWHAVCYDPPYIPAGGDTTSTAGDFQDRFGLRGGRNQDQLDDLVHDGLREAARVFDQYLLVKAMDYVNGGRFTPQTYRLVVWATHLGLHLHDEIVHHAGSGPGGHNIVTQKRARRHHSKLLVFTRERL